MTRSRLLELFYRWGLISLSEYLASEYPAPKYTYEDCQEWTPDLLDF